MKTISIYNNYLPHSQAKREEIVRRIKKEGFETGRSGDFTFVLGGDGTFFKAINKNFLDDSIFVLLNTGNLGFLSEFDAYDFDRVFDLMKRENYQIEELPIYEVTIALKNKKKTLHFINDLSIERNSSRIIHTSIEVNDDKMGYISGDGIIVSTALGSTGYNLSAGGSIVYDCHSLLQLTPVAPLNNKSYNSLSSPLILDDENNITIFPNVKKNRPFRVVVDGFEVKLENAKYLDIKKHEKTVKILRSNQYKKLENIRKKMMDQNF